jgi:uncharacterized protein Yka (UPF0111/DUF47 family)
MRGAEVQDRLHGAVTHVDDAVDSLNNAARIVDGLSDRLHDEVEAAQGRVIDVAMQMYKALRALDGVL